MSGSAHVHYACISCCASAAEDYFDVEDGDWPDEIPCDACGAVAYEDGAEFFEGGEQVDGFGECDACGEFYDYDGICSHCGEDNS